MQMQGRGERTVVKRNPSTDVYFTTPLMRDAVWSHGNSIVRRRMVGLVAFPNGCIREAEYQETSRRFSDLYRRPFCTFHHVLHRACSSPISRFYAALMLIRDAYSLGILVVFSGIVDYFRPPVPMYHHYSILNHLRVPFVGRARTSSRAWDNEKKC